MKIKSLTLTSFLFTFAFALITVKVDANSFQVITIKESLQDTIKDKTKTNGGEWTSKIITQDGDRKVVIETTNGEITSLEINSKKIPKEDYNQYNDILEKHNSPKGSKSKPIKNFDFSFDDFQIPSFNKRGDSSRVFQFKMQDMDSIFGGSGFKMDDDGALELRLNQLFNNPMGDSIFSKMFERNKSFGDGISPEDLEGFFNSKRPLKMEMDEFGLTPNQIQENKKGGSLKENTKTKNLEQLLGEQLNKDGLLTANKENKVELSGKYLRINGKKMPQVTFEKFKSLFEIETGMPLNEATTLSFMMEGKTAERNFKAF